MSENETLNLLTWYVVDSLVRTSQRLVKAQEYATVAHFAHIESTYAYAYAQAHKLDDGTSDGHLDALKWMKLSDACDHSLAINEMTATETEE